MNKKIFAIAVITMFLITGLTTIPAQIVPVSLNNNEITTQNNNIDQPDDIKLSESTLLEILDSVTIGDLVELLRDYVQDNSHEMPYKTMMMRFLENGIQSMEKLGLTSKTTLFKARDLLSFSFFDRGQVKYRSFLINILPLQATVSTIIPSYEVNISKIEVNPFGNLTVKFELFVKVIPFIDRITTRQFGILRPLLTQSAIIWPTIGGRITIAGFTLFILAFGPRIKWTRATSR